MCFSLWLLFRELLFIFLFFLKLHLKLPWGVMLGGGAPRWQIKDRIKGNRPRSAQAQLDTPIPPACPESHSSRSSSSLEHSAEDTMSSVVCREREDSHPDALQGLFTGPQPSLSRISLLTQTSRPVLRRPYITSVNHISQCLSFFTLCAFHPCR